MYKKYFKYPVDFTIALLGLIISSPFFIIMTICLFISNSGKPFFFQQRPGKNCKIFKVIKFKTMNDKKDKDGNLLSDAERLTKIGKFVRKTSLDELPQLVNVIKGDMSLIGPRPLVPIYLSLFSPEQARRQEVKPGITGWAQVNGRNLMKLSKKFEYDVWYVDHLSFKLDSKIFLLTVKNILLKKDIGEGGMDMETVDDLGFMEKIRSIN